jgi:hypothetical protein
LVVFSLLLHVEVEPRLALVDPPPVGPAVDFHL